MVEFMLKLTNIYETLYKPQVKEIGSSFDDELYDMIGNDFGTNGEGFLGIFLGDEIVGGVLLSPDHLPWEYRFDIVIDKKHRRKGYSHLLIRELVRLFKSDSEAEQLSAQVINPSLVDILVRHGFSEGEYEGDPFLWITKDVNEAEVGPMGDIVGRMTIDDDMDKLESKFEDVLERNYTGDNINGFQLGYDGDSMVWRNERGDMMIDFELFHNHNFESRLGLYKLEDLSGTKEWKAVKVKDMPVDPDILNAHVDDIIENYFYNLGQFMATIK